MKKWNQIIAKKEQVGFYMLPNMTPYLEGVGFNEVPEDMDKVLQRAYHKKELTLGVSLPGKDAAVLLQKLYEKYNDEEHRRKMAITDAKDAEDKRNRMLSQDEYKTEW